MFLSFVSWLLCVRGGVWCGCGEEGEEREEDERGDGLEGG